MSIDVAKNVTISEIVTQSNINILRKFVFNGYNLYPGANFIIKDDITISLMNKNNIDIKVGDIVYRHPVTGDKMVYYRDRLLYRELPKYTAVVDPKLKSQVYVKYNIGIDYDGDQTHLL